MVSFMERIRRTVLGQPGEQRDTLASVAQYRVDPDFPIGQPVLGPVDEPAEPDDPEPRK